MDLIKIASIEIQKFTWDYVDSNSYIIYEEENALIVDPIDTGDFWEHLINKEICTATVFLTHEHFDHICGLNRLRKELKCTVYAHSECSQNICLVKKNMSNVANIISEFNGSVSKEMPYLPPFSCRPADKLFNKRVKMRWCDHDIVFIPTPGHSPGSACMIFDNVILMSGDTLLGVPTITRFPGGNREIFRDTTLPILYALKDQIQYVLPGHGSGGRIEDMILKNA